MKDITLKGTVVKRELTIFLITFFIATGINIYSIITYDTPWGELYTSMGFVVILALIFYLLLAVIRMVATGVHKIFGDRKQY